MPDVPAPRGPAPPARAARPLARGAGGVVRPAPPHRPALHRRPALEARPGRRALPAPVDPGRRPRCPTTRCCTPAWPPTPRTCPCSTPSSSPTRCAGTTANFMGASLDHCMWFHRPFRADEWLLYDTDSPVAAGARGLARGFFFDRSGRLVVSMVQEGLTRVDRLSPRRPAQRSADAGRSPARRRRCRAGGAGRSWSPGPSSSCQCDSQPEVRGMAKSTGNISSGKPMAW